MAAITRLGETFDTASGTKTVTATPAVNDLIVIVTAHSGNLSTAVPTDDQAGTYTTIIGSQKATDADRMMFHIRTVLIPSAVSTVFSHAPGTTTGGGLIVYKVTGMTRTGAVAALQSAREQNQAAATPAPVFGSVPQLGNPVIGAAFNATNPAGLTPRTGYTEDPTPDLGYATPDTGLEAMFLNSGETSATITWGGASASAFCSAVIELDTTAAAPAAIVDDVRRILQDEPSSDSISTAPSPTFSGTTISFGTANLWFKDDVADIPATGEQVLITSADNTNPFTIVRAHNETTQAPIGTTHRALKSPQYGTKQIEEAIERVVSRLWPRVWELSTATITPGNPQTTYLYDGGTTFEGSVDLIQSSSGSITDIVRHRYGSDYADTFNVPTGVLSSGKGIRVRRWHRLDANATLTYRAKVTSSTTEATLQHAIALGAAEELLESRAAELSAKSDRKEGEIQDILRAARFHGDRFDRAIASWRGHLRNRDYGKRRFVR